MGFLDTIARIGTAVVTGGTSEIARLVAPGLVQTAQGLLFPTNLSQAATTAALVAGVNPGVLGTLAKGTQFVSGANVFVGPNMKNVTFGQSAPPPSTPYLVPGTPYTPDQFNALAAKGVNPMGFDLNSLLSGVGGAISGLFGNSPNPALQTVGQVGSLAQNFLPIPSNPTYGIAPQPVAMRLPAPPTGAVRALPSIGRSFFNKYPNLAAGMNALRMTGKNVKRSQLYSMLKRFGPDLLITGGILSAAAVSELMVAGPGRRTMNVANAKALRRAARRIKGFHRLCQHTDLIKSRSRRSSSRCGTCRKSPCRC